MWKTLFKLLNPIDWFRAYRFHKTNSGYDKSSYDLELFLYSRILRNDMLHYGYFDDIHIASDTISVKQIEDAQIKYAENIINQISNKDGLILDVGCGMGGLLELLLQKNFKVEALTPNINQKQHIDSKYKGLICHNKKFENFNTNKKFGIIINSESLQYINLETAFEKVDSLLVPGGKWIIGDYFRTAENSINKSGHYLKDFNAKVKASGWKITYEQDITLNVLPTIKFLNMYAERFLQPIKHFAFEKLRFKKAWLYYLTENLRTGLNNKLNKELAAIDPDMFFKEKQYMLFVIEKPLSKNIMK